MPRASRAQRNEFSQKLSPKAKKELRMVDALAKAISRDDLLPMLEGQTDQRFVNFLNLLLQPGQRKAMCTLARECGIGYRDFADLILKHKMAEGLVRMSAHVPQVLEDVAEDAKSRLEVCAKCEGTGVVASSEVRKGEDEREGDEPIPEACKLCKGEGVVRVPGDAIARKLIFETGGLTGKVVPLVDARSQHLHVEGDEGLEAIVRMTRKALEVPSPQVVEGDK